MNNAHRRIYRRFRRGIARWWIDRQIAELLSWEAALVEDGLASPGVFALERTRLRSRRVRLLSD